MKKYCCECKLPLANSNASTCDKCGKPARPMDIFERVASDELLPSKDKKLFGFIGAMNIAACVISLIWLPLMIAAASEISAGIAYRLSKGLIEPENILRFTYMIALYRAVKFFCVVMIFEQLGTLFFNVMILLKKAWAVQVCRVLYIVNVVLYFLFGNLISLIIGLCISIKLDGFISKMESGAEYDRRAEDVIRSAEIANDKSVWQCKGCGYVNPVSAAECKSCGKWKD